jgi:hypothetical protein
VHIGVRLRASLDGSGHSDFVIGLIDVEKLFLKIAQLAPDPWLRKTTFIA